MELWTRRRFFVGSVVGGALAGAGRLVGETLGTSATASEGVAEAPRAVGGARPVMVSSANGVNALPKGMVTLGHRCIQLSE